MFLPFASLVLDSFGFASGVCPDCRLRPHGNHDHIHGDLVSCLVCFLSASPSPSPSPIPRSRPSSRIVFLPFVVIVILVVVAGSRRARFPSRLPVLLLVLLARGLRHAVLEPRQVVVDLAAARLGGLGLVHTLPQGLLDLRARRRRVACGCPACCCSPEATGLAMNNLILESRWSGREGGRVCQDVDNVPRTEDMIVTQGRSLVPLGAWTRRVLTGGRRNGLWWTDVIVYVCVCVFLGGWWLIF